MLASPPGRRSVRLEFVALARQAVDHAHATGGDRAPPNPATAEREPLNVGAGGLSSHNASAVTAALRSATAGTVTNA